ncbi:MAG: DNA helicase RecG, partial [bacterium]|nr:DNA helicase RecG [bacterium]
MQFSDSIASIQGVGPVFQKRLKGMGITSIRDLLFYFPRSYQDLSQTTPIRDVKENEDVCVKGTLQDIQEMRTFRKRMSVTEALLQDGTGTIRIVWFNQPYLITSLHKGEDICCAGRVVRDSKGMLLSNPSYEKLTNGELTHLGRIIPLYAETRGVSSRWLRVLIKSLLHSVPAQETLPPSLLAGKGFLPLHKALSEIHFPTSLEHTEQAKKRFAFEELFIILLFVMSERKKLARVKAHVIKLQEPLMKRFTQSLPFSLTNAQKKAAWHILKDMEKPRPMNRLLQGDVGSGKTVVAAMASLSAVRSAYQVVFMAPTEILA